MLAVPVISPGADTLEVAVTGAYAEAAIPTNVNGDPPRYVMLQTNVATQIFVRPVLSGENHSAADMMALSIWHPLVLHVAGYSHLGHVGGGAGRTIYMTPLEDQFIDFPDAVAFEGAKTPFLTGATSEAATLPTCKNGTRPKYVLLTNGDGADEIYVGFGSSSVVVARVAVQATGIITFTAGQVPVGTITINGAVYTFDDAGATEYTIDVGAGGAEARDAVIAKLNAATDGRVSVAHLRPVYLGG
jgi:hypothetical protein